MIDNLSLQLMPDLALSDDQSKTSFIPTWQWAWWANQFNMFHLSWLWKYPYHHKMIYLFDKNHKLIFHVSLCYLLSKIRFIWQNWTFVPLSFLEFLFKDPPHTWDLSSDFLLGYQGVILPIFSNLQLFSLLFDKVI